MKYIHKMTVAVDLTKRSQQLNSTLDAVSAMTEKLDPVGSPLSISLDEMKATILSNVTYTSAKAKALAAFCTEYADADYLENTGKTLVQWQTLLDKFTTVSDAVAVAIPKVKNDGQLLNVKDVILPEDPIIPVKMSQDIHHGIMVNDFLDASYYTLRGINPSNGEALNMTDVELRQKTLAYLNQIDNLNVSSPPELVDDVQNMKDVGHYVIDHINDDLLTLSDYIGMNVEKLPLVRRMWANG